jgi:PAX-interacting protein 1
MLQQRRTLGNITNAAGAVVGGVPQAIVQQMIPQSPGAGSGGSGVVIVPQSPQPQLKAPPFSPGRAPPQQLPRPQFYGHNPNLKLPAELFLLGCNFFIVEYDESHKDEVPDWKKLIMKHGGDIQEFYCARVTHVLCRTQRHGVVMQAIRDTKRCVTAYWLNDTIRKKQVLPPWQALHFPFPSTFGLQKPATKHIMSITGFEGEERDRIKTMIEESGARLTTYFSKQNTVLICKSVGASTNMKEKKAKEWNVPLVNVAWLSDILLGNLSGMSQYETQKYQQFNNPTPFKIDYVLVPQLMSE